jgi:uncharacterized protein with beta-barrel porin domain
MNGRPLVVSLVFPTVAVLSAVLVIGPAHVRADGGKGGQDLTPTPGGAGGTGFTGNPGSPPAAGLGGGGGGGAGGGPGGPSGGGSAGGAGGTAGSPNGHDGASGGGGPVGGGGGGGGFNGNGAGTATLTNTAPLTGGNGGNGGSSASPIGGGGGGGAGGFGAIVTGAGASSNSSPIRGGNGGGGGASGLDTNTAGGNGGDGGVGLQFTAAGATLTNSGTISGGNGGAGGPSTNPGVGTLAGTPGRGGAGIVGSGLTVINSGTIVGGLSGDGVTRADAVTFTGGTNLLNELAGANLIGNLTVGAGTTITGTGTSTMTGAYTQGGGTYQVNTAGGTSTHIVITGTATITGGTVVVTGTGTPGTTFAILTATAGRTGTYAGLIDDIPNTTATLTYDPNDVFVVLTAFAPRVVTGQTFNQQSVAAAAGGLGPAFAQLASLPQNQQPFALDQLSGEIHASNVTAGLENQGLFLRTLAERLRQGRCLCGADAAAPGCEPDDAWHAWGTPFGQAGKATDNGNAHGFAFDSVGFAAGADRWLTGSTLIGCAAGYDDWQNNTDLLGSRSDVNSFLLGLYAYQQMGRAWLLGIVGYENDSYDTARPIDFLAATARGNYSGNQVGSYLEAGYGIDVGGLQVQPIGAAQYISLWREAFGESGAGVADLDVSSARADSFRSYLGGRLLYPWNVAGRCALPEARAFWVHEYAADTRNTSNTFAGGGPDFLVYGQNLGRDWGDFGLGLSMQLGSRVRVGLQYDAFVNADAVAHGGWGQVQLSW